MAGLRPSVAVLAAGESRDLAVGYTSICNFRPAAAENWTR